MSITDELRTEARGFGDYIHTSEQAHRLLAIADRIDAEHQKAMDEWKAKHGQMWLKGYKECHAELLDGNETLASDLESCGWVRLPKDADGRYVHIGDVMSYADNTKPMEVVALVPPAVFLTDDGPRYADMCRHYKPPTVEDLLRDMHMKLDEVTALYVGEAIGSDERDRDEARIFAEYAAKLQLRGEDE